MEDNLVRQRHSSSPKVSTVASDNRTPTTKPQHAKTTIHSAALRQSDQYRPTDRPMTAAAAAAMHARAACPQYYKNNAHFAHQQQQRYFATAAQNPPKPATPSAPTTPTPSRGFSTSKTLFIFAVIFGCFAMLYPKIFHPMVRSVFHHNDEQPSPTIASGGGDGVKLITPPELLDPALRRAGPPPLHQTPMGSGGRRGPHPGMRGHEHHASRGGGGSKGYVSTLLPLYAIGVIGFLCFTLFKILFKPKNNNNGQLMNGAVPYGADHRQHQAYYASSGQYYQNMAHSPATMAASVYHHHPNCPSSSGCEMHTKPDPRFPIIDALRRLQVNGETLADSDSSATRVAKRKILEEALPENDVAVNSGIEANTTVDNESVAGDHSKRDVVVEQNEKTENTIGDDAKLLKPPNLSKVQQKMAETQHKINSIKQNSDGDVAVKPAEFLDIQQQLLEMQQQMQAMMSYIQQTQSHSTSTADAASTPGDAATEEVQLSKNDSANNVDNGKAVAAPAVEENVQVPSETQKSAAQETLSSEGATSSNSTTNTTEREAQVPKTENENDGAQKHTLSLRKQTDEPLRPQQAPDDKRESDAANDEGTAEKLNNPTS